MEDFSKYAHSPVHLAVARGDHATLKQIISTLPRLAKADEVNNEEESLAAELQADAVSAVIDRRDVPGRETPLHLAVRLKDPTSAEILMTAGANWSLQNENGWSALQEAVCSREENIAMIIARHYPPLAWAKWCRRLPRIVATASRIRDFYMEITFHFESSVIPFIGRIAPSDTYRIWKRGSNLRTDMTLADFPLPWEGYSSEDGNTYLPPGSLIVLSHKNKEITNALEGAGAQPTEAEVAREVTTMSQTNMYRPGIDVTQAELVPHLNWRRNQRTEMVGNWKAKVYDMLHVMVSVKSRRVPGSMTDDELFSVDNDDKIVNGGEFDEVLTAEERMQLNSALCMGDSEVLGEDEEHSIQECHENGKGGSFDSCQANGNGVRREKKSWFGRKKDTKHGGDDHEDTKILKKSSKLGPESSNHHANDCRTSSSEIQGEVIGDTKKNKDKNSKKKKKKEITSESKNESEVKRGLRPVLWLTSDFPLKTEELLPLLDILANKVKAVRRMRELLTTKLPHGTFPVKLAIPIVPTVRVIVTFTKFEELQPVEEFSTPPSSPVHFEDGKSKESEGSASWISWMRGSQGGQSSDSDHHSFRDETDPSTYHLTINGLMLMRRNAG
ncbi:hypothetical protein NMG60_11008781 [Bertholletia excelsa]